MTDPQRMLRCAVYTRKSTDEGLEQEFNSLDAQFLACSAYIESQRGEGWLPVNERYDDGGLSGATLDRPALKRLLEDISNRKVDLVVVYKVDRLTRSLHDFSKLVDHLDRNACSFVSVTQSFNTSNSIGRLTLNILLSFAQFEREVTAERIRDKIAASKKLGLWMGGVPSLGYAVANRQLVVVPVEAETVRTVFQLYLNLRCITATRREADRLGLRSRPRRLSDGSFEAARFSRSRVEWILTNCAYIGEVHYKGRRYPGRQPPIIDRETWDRAQSLLATRAGGRRGGGVRKYPSSPLKGLVFDEVSDRLTPTYSSKVTGITRYYVSRRLLATTTSKGSRTGWRVRADYLEGAVAELIRKRLGEPGLASEFAAGGMTSVLEAEKGLNELAALSDARLLQLVCRVTVEPGTLIVVTNLDALAAALGVSAIVVPAVLLEFRGNFTKRRTWVEAKRSFALTDPGRSARMTSQLRRAAAWWLEVRGGVRIAQIAKREALSHRRVMQILDLAFLAPELVDAAIDGRLSKLPSDKPLSLLWSEQVAALLPE